MTAHSVVTVSFPEPDIALLTLNDPNKGANVLSSGVLDELDRHLSQLEKRTDLAGLIIRSGKPGSFIAGADLREFASSFDRPKSDVTAMCRRGQTLFQRLSRTPFVTVAAIDGICVGGGAELAIWCDCRILADDSKTQFGFPEVKIGLFPGWGGTARTPRIVGLANAVELITSGEPIAARAAASMGLASDVVAPEQIQAAAVRLARDHARSRQYLADREAWNQPIAMSDTELTFLGATASAYIQQQTAGQYPAPMAALETMLSAAGLDSDAACVAEAEAMAELFGSPVNRALINVFFLTDRNKKDTGVDHPVAPKPVVSVAVLGAGIMGAGIAAANLKRKMPIALADASTSALAHGVQQVLEEAAYNKESKKADPQKALEMAPLLNATTSDEEIAACDIVIEAIVENASVKKSVYARLEPRLKPEAILATNTSTIPIAQLAEGLARPERFCGIHFFNPVRRMPLVEVIRGPKTSDEVIATAVAYAKQIGKSPIVVNDGPGFLVNRLLFPYMNEALELLSEGIEIKAIERAAKDFGMPMGPITLYDVVGLDTAMYAGRVMWEAFPDRIAASPILPALVKAGRLGQKSGAGFFKYRDRKAKGEPDPALQPIISPYFREPVKLSHEQVTARLFLPMVLEATRVIEARIVRDVRDIDLGLIFGLGFPAFKGGLLAWADSLGAKKLVEMLKPFESLDNWLKATPLLLELAASGRKFYDLDLRKTP